MCLTSTIGDINKHNASSFCCYTEPPCNINIPHLWMNVRQIHPQLDYLQTKQIFVMRVAKAGDICSMSRCQIQKLQMLHHWNQAEVKRLRGMVNILRQQGINRF